VPASTKKPCTASFHARVSVSELYTLVVLDNPSLYVADHVPTQRRRAGRHVDAKRRADELPLP
jgi:hypothetical protein